jgi:hypothetical protein
MSRYLSNRSASLPHTLCKRAVDRTDTDITRPVSPAERFPTWAAMTGRKTINVPFANAFII